jgi:hypothetical protein
VFDGRTVRGGPGPAGNRAQAPGIGDGDAVGLGGFRDDMNDLPDAEGEPCTAVARITEGGTSTTHFIREL